MDSIFEFDKISKLFSMYYILNDDEFVTFDRKKKFVKPNRNI